MSGEVKLSHEHSNFQWVNSKEMNWPADRFFNKEEYEAFKKYFEALS